MGEMEKLGGNALPHPDPVSLAAHPFAAIRGVLWDQGESGTKIPGVDQYTVMKALIAGWRKAWGIEDLPLRAAA